MHSPNTAPTPAGTWLSFAGMLLLLTLLTAGGAGSTGCQDELKCGEHEREVNGRCVCEYGYTSVAGVCVPSSPTDGDIDMNTDGDATEEEETGGMTHAGTCADPQPLELGVAMETDLSDGAEDGIENPCVAADNPDMDWSGPDHVFTFAITEDMVSDRVDLSVTIDPKSSTSMAYAAYLRFDTSGETTDVCDSADAVFCQQYSAVATAGSDSITLTVGKPDFRPQEGDVLYIYVDSLSDDESTPGAYSITVQETPCDRETAADRCVNDPRQPSLVEICQTDGSWLAETTCSSDNICLLNEDDEPVCATAPVDGDEDGDVDDTDVTDVTETTDDVDDTDVVDTTEDVDTDQPADGLAVLDTYTLPGDLATTVARDIALYTLDSGTRFAALRDLETGSAWYWNIDFAYDFSVLTPSEVPSFQYGGLGVNTSSGAQVTAINIHYNPTDTDMNKKIIGVGGVKTYPEGLTTVEGITLDPDNNIWLVGDGALWKIDSNNAGTQYPITDHTRLMGVSYATVGSSQSLLVLSNNDDDTESRVLQILLADPGTIANSQKLSVPVVSIAYDERGEYHLWGGLADITGGKHIVKFACLAFEPGQSQCSNE